MKCSKDWFALCRTTLACIAVVVSYDPDTSFGEPFQNLGFESATGTPVGYQWLASAALPGWTSNGVHGGYLIYDTVSAGSVYTSIQDAAGYLKPLVGNYSIILQEGAGSETRDEDDYISQTGDVPTYAKSLMFRSDWLTSPDRLQVSLGGVAIPFTLYSVGGTVNPSCGPVKTYACDISAFTSETDVDLRFTATGRDSMVDLDAITFSSIIVPEPSSLLFLTVAALGTSAYIFHRRASR